MADEQLTPLTPLQDGLDVTNKRTTHVRLQRGPGRAQPLLLRLIDLGRQPIAVTPVVVKGGTTLVTDGDGKVKVPLPASAAEVVLRVDDPTTALDAEVPVKVGALAPLATPEGQLQRLRNLGYFTGDLPGEAVGPDEDPFAVAGAVEEFQCDEGLPVTGQLDGATQARLAEVHGS